MPEPSPAYLWYPKDALSSGRIDELSASEECWYRRALDRSWLDDGIPADPAKLARQIKKGCTEKAAAMILETFFEPHKKDSAKRVNPRQEKERKKFSESQKQKSLAGKRGMEKRWKRDKQKTSGDNTVITPLYQSYNIPIAIPSSIPKEEKATTTTTSRAKPTDTEWLEDLQKNPAYRLLNIQDEFARATVWAETNNRQCTRRFFVGWINRAKPMEIKPNGQNGNGKYTSEREKSAQRESNTLAAIAELNRLADAEEQALSGINNGNCPPDAFVGESTGAH